MLYESCLDSLTGSPGKSHSAGDRFIPNRSAMDLDVSHYALTNNNTHDAENTDGQINTFNDMYKKELAQTLMCSDPSSAKVLALKSKAPKPSEEHENSLRVLYTQNREKGVSRKTTTRHIPSAPERILDAPELLDDYYLNLLDWSSTNQLGVALGDSVYIWNGETGSINNLLQCQGEDQHVTSLSWIQEGSYMAVGTSDHKVQIWDVEKQKQVRSMSGHKARVGSLAWNGPLLSSGSRDSTIIHHDVRVPEHKVGELKGHTQEVCGLKWSPQGHMLASGGNDNLLNIWDDRYAVSNGSAGVGSSVTAPLHRLTAHQAAVKALAWCPWQRNLLASGGGTADRMIRFWNAQTGECTRATDTHSQVCSLQWSLHDRELVSSHGYSHNQLIVWKYPTMVKAAELTGHTSRVLHMAQSPDGRTIVSAAADETLRFWNILSGPNASKGKADSKPSALSATSIR